ncbi:alpha/beta fold hydrolase [Fodinicola feengrottensis]|uniref:Alpha/beta fold hydrolase n=1 Tax=Fodinicola feengrottensis TaxID=435914 RepID=A0ABP4VDW5_9ACTN|nr:alpha/beta fold hydrolase [Fodinicola feengrottensis]
MTVSVRTVTLHGHDVGYRELEPAPDSENTEVVVLLHGLAGSAETWLPVLERLSPSRRRFIAPDLLGHGSSAKPRGDYSLGAYASGVRDLLAALGHEHATIVGHSLGGGIAMQFAYQFPQSCDRLVLVSSGGLGRTVSPVLRSAVLPGAGLVLPVIAHRRVISAASRMGRTMQRWKIGTTPTLREYARHFASLSDPEGRKAFLHTARSVLDIGGQRVSGTDRLYLAENVPTMVMWGSIDPVIPMRHGERAASVIPDCRLEIFERAGHFPHCDQPGRFSRTLLDFLDNTEPARLEISEVAARLTAVRPYDGQASHGKSE